MKSMKKCNVTYKKRLSQLEQLFNKHNKHNKRCSSAGMFYTSSAGAVTSLILIALFSLFGSFFGLTGTTNTYATTSTLTLSVTDSVSLNIVPTSSNGTFATSDTTTPNISVTTNHGTGYTLGIKASTNNSNALINTADSQVTIPSISSSTFPSGVSEANYKDDTYASTNNLNNTWGYRPSKLNSVANSNYLPAPTSASTITTLDKTTVSNPSTANTYNIALGTRITDTTVKGSYTNTFVITAVVNPTIYSITYNKNTTDTVTNMPTNVVNQQTTGETVNISSTVPVRDGYNFKGWCTTQTADGASCTGTTYNPDGGGTNLTWTLDQTAATNSLSIYAMWEINDPCLGKTALYDLVACRSKGTQTLAQLRAAIVAPTSSATVSSNSGVYEYDASVFGAATDAASTHKIYYYRGILDSYGNTGTYGSDGKADAYPNYVKLGTTCWRIVRTTGSGGVKMIYNGTYGATTSDSCANTQTNAQVTTKAFGDTAAVYRSIVGVGYTRNATYAKTSATTATAYSTLFGSNSSYSGNSTASDMKTYIEGTWFSNINSYASKLEQSAGWCNDRSIRSSSSSTSVISNSTTIVPYGTSGMTQHYFGSYVRTRTTSDKPTLGCPRNNADLYTTSSAPNGNKQLGKPVALLTADEAAFAGSGYDSSTTPYHANSYLRSGSDFWLLSPLRRSSGGFAYGFYLSSSGYLNDSVGVNNAFGVRPAISLTSGTTAASGTGTATDPWIVNP